MTTYGDWAIVNAIVNVKEKHKKKILVAGKDAYNYYPCLSDYFEQFDLSFTQNGKQIVAYLKEHTPTLIVLGILGQSLGNTTVLKLSQAIRKNSRLAKIKILLLVSEKTDVDDIDIETKTLMDKIVRHSQQPTHLISHVAKLLKASKDLSFPEQDIDIKTTNGQFQIPVHQNYESPHTLQSEQGNVAVATMPRTIKQVVNQTTVPTSSMPLVNQDASPSLNKSITEIQSSNITTFAPNPKHKETVPEVKQSKTFVQKHEPVQNRKTQDSEMVSPTQSHNTSYFDVNYLEPTSSKTIAIIEDNASIAFLEKSILERQGYKTIQIADAPQARDFIDTHFELADLFLLDLNLPGGSGFEILRRIRSFSRKPVIIVSGLKQSENIKRGLSLGAQDYLTKPVNPQELILRVSQHIKNFT